MSNDNIVPFGSRDNLTKFAMSALVTSRYGGADAERLNAFERVHGLRLSEPYRGFLMRENGLDYSVPHDRIKALSEDERRDAFVLSDINLLFGIATVAPELSKELR